MQSNFHLAFTHTYLIFINNQRLHKPTVHLTVHLHTWTIVISNRDKWTHHNSVASRRRRPYGPKSRTWEPQSLQSSYFSRPLSNMRFLTAGAKPRSPSPVVEKKLMLGLRTEDARNLKMKPLFQATGSSASLRQLESSWILIKSKASEETQTEMNWKAKHMMYWTRMLSAALETVLVCWPTFCATATCSNFQAMAGDNSNPLTESHVLSPLTHAIDQFMTNVQLLKTRRTQFENEKILSIMGDLHGIVDPSFHLGDCSWNKEDNYAISWKHCGDTC